MGFNQTKEAPLIIGIDGGGSKCRATIYASDDSVLGTGVAGRANPLFGLSQTLESIQHSTELALADAGLKVSDSKKLVAGLGLAGVNVPHLYQELIKWQHPFAEMFVTTDLHTACIGAHHGGDGAVIITGTGSCGYAHVGDNSLSLGGHGFPLGDKGSGAWFGLKAAEAALLHLDGFGPKTALTEMVLNHFQVSNTLGIVEHLAGKSSSCYATLAREVLLCAREQDTVAKEIVMQGAGYISELARKLFSINPPRFSMIGGLAEPLAPWLDKEVVERISPVIAPPELGACYFARQRYTVSD
ncbi:BadF/BadG/BcrA/BcrD ATPase family protein [Shewanella sp. Isolate11]|uniref:N-acetylglucosamine kinase n=1 Tax=Shewanella sp. Isolate11 TaxID=2908530 RepID=UPI001EFED3F8|nr:BadF/BadG/BcrA/BcrD ATPase family protein [Shewanella sp. Isolate11]MCG9696006.1 ATPase [Shewanella sp. Isolate11]